jgi:oligoendopeptidase F
MVGCWVLDLNKVRLDVENLCSEVNREYYLNWAGLKDDMNISGIFEKYRSLFTKELIMELARKRKESRSDEEERRLRYLQGFLISGYLDRVVSDLTDRSETMQAKETVKLNGEEIPFRLSRVKLANEPDRERRAKLFEARNMVIDKLNVVLKERMQKLHMTAKELGYENYMELFKDVRSIDFKELEKIMQGFLEQTSSLYVKIMDRALKEKMGIRLKDAERHDIIYFMRAEEFDSHFRKEEAVQTLKQTLANMGIHLERQKNIYIDAEERPKKSPRAFCAAIHVPEDVKLVIMPEGGHNDYAALFHEAGHAEHFASVNPSLAIEYKWLGDNSVTESFASLLEYLMMDENWLRQHTKMGENEAKHYLSFLSLITLFALRRYGAKLSYEIKLHSDGLEGADELYKKIMEKHLQYKEVKNHYLIDVDDGFYCTQYIQAWIFEAQLRTWLKKEYGEEWFNNPKAGKFLTSLWSQGQKYNVAELAQQLGYKGLDIQPLTTIIQKHLQ